MLRHRWTESCRFMAFLYTVQKNSEVLDLYLTLFVAKVEKTGGVAHSV